MHVPPCLSATSLFELNLVYDTDRGRPTCARGLAFAAHEGSSSPLRELAENILSKPREKSVAQIETKTATQNAAKTKNIDKPIDHEPNTVGAKFGCFCGRNFYRIQWLAILEWSACTWCIITQAFRVGSRGYTCRCWRTRMIFKRYDYPRHGTHGHGGIRELRRKQEFRVLFVCGFEAYVPSL